MGVHAGYTYGKGSRNRAHSKNYLSIEKGFAYVLSHPEIKKVILADFIGCFQYWGISSLGYTDKQSPQEILSDGISQTFKALSDAGKEVVFVLDVPAFSKDAYDMSRVNACQAKLDSVKLPKLHLRAVLSSTISQDHVDIAEVCSMPEAENGTAEGHVLLDNLVREESNKYRNVHVVDLSRFFCHNGRCSMIMGGKMLYGDSHHLSKPGSFAVAPEIFKAFDDGPVVALHH